MPVEALKDGFRNLEDGIWVISWGAALGPPLGGAKAASSSPGAASPSPWAVTLGPSPRDPRVQPWVASLGFGCSFCQS